METIVLFKSFIALLYIEQKQTRKIPPWNEWNSINERNANAWNRDVVSFNERLKPSDMNAMH